jgi:hypothetical protein
MHRPSPQPQTKIPYQQQADGSLLMPPTLSPPQHQQSDSRSTQNGCCRQESTAIIDSRHPQGCHRHRQNGDAPQLHYASAVGRPYQNVTRQCNYDPMAHVQGYHSTFNQVGPQHHRDMPYGTSDSLNQHDDSQYQSNYYISHLPTGADNLFNLDDYPHYQQSGSLQQISTEASDRGYQTRLNSFPQYNGSLSHDSLQSSLIFENNSINGDWLLENFPDLSKNPNDLNIPLDNQQLNMQDNATAKQPIPASQHQCYNPPQHATHQSVSQNSPDHLTVSSQNDQTYSKSNLHQLNCSCEGQHENLEPSAEGYRNNSISDNPAPGPQPPPLPYSAVGFTVLHDGHKLPSWKLNGKTRVKVDPDEFPSRRPKERDKCRRRRKRPHSIAPSQTKHPLPYVPAESLDQALQSCPTRNSTVKRNTVSSKVTVCSNLRDSGYFSVNSALCNSLLLSLSSLNLTDDPSLKTDYKDIGGGLVEVEAKWRMKLSDLEKLSESLVNDPSSQSLAA